MSSRNSERRSFYKGNRNWRSKTAVTEQEPPLGALVREVIVKDLCDEAMALEESSSISNCTTVTSYNWVHAKEPTILVPGKPPRWTPLRRPMRIPEDNGIYYRDRNAAQFPHHPMEPATLALLTTEPNFVDEHQIDVITCSSVLGNLLNFIRGDDKKFRVSVQLINGTAFLVRRENSPRQLIPDVVGFGHTFPKHYTTWDAETKGSSSHQRVLSYQFGRLHLLVRFEADGYIAKSFVSPKQPRDDQSPSVSVSLDALQESMHAMKVSSVITSGTKVHIISSGEVVDQQMVFDLKTRSSKKQVEDTVQTYLPRLWTAQINQFVLARHDDGVFNEIQILDVQERVKNWERDHVTDLSRLAALLHQIIAELRKTPSAKLEVRRAQGDTLEIREQLPETGEALSSSTMDLWCSREDNSKKTVLDFDEADDNIE